MKYIYVYLYKDIYTKTNLHKEVKFQPFLLIKVTVRKTVGEQRRLGVTKENR